MILNTEMHEVTVKGNEVRPTPTEYKILEVMCKTEIKYLQLKSYTNLYRKKNIQFPIHLLCFI
ncbi:hypothetical protein CBU02nite_24610 [Clostridium butyricum]|uniref:Uncharacterized protein n=1 Tax=Clostridium butyricum TaxID=1492 RepID=A0A512TNZ0_CLOBU|nr:DNA-binding response OmpR family regulator [Clostridium butyricum]GEQ21955.1 hypothetical protein CBU02nite_24610 [Clostridium butyricum]